MRDDLSGDRACRSFPSLKFVGLHSDDVGYMALIFGHGVKRPGDLDRLILELVRNVTRGTNNRPVNFGVSICADSLSISGQTASN